MRSGGNIIQTQRLRTSTESAACRRENRLTPGCGRGRATVTPHAGRPADHVAHSEKAGLDPRPLCCTNPVSGGAPFQRGRNLSRLSPGFAFAARSAGQPFITPDHHPTPCPEVHVNDLAHLSVLKSAEPVRPVAVIHQ